MGEMPKQLTDVDVAYQILAAKGSPLYFRDLIDQVLASKGRPVHSLPHAMAEVHTQINMDRRFVHMGKGTWGLSEWLPQRGGKAAEETAATVSPEVNMRRERLLAEIQQDFPAAAPDAEEGE